MNKQDSIIQFQYPGIVQRLLARYIHLLAKSYERYGRLKKAQAPDIIVDIERVLIRKRLLFLFTINSDLLN